MLVLLPELSVMAFSRACATNGGLVPSNFAEVYRTDQDRFWQLAKFSRDSAVRCTSENEMTSFLRLSEPGEGNAEFSEFFSEAVEGLLVRKSECVLPSLSRMKKKDRTSVLQRLRAPLFADKAEIGQVFERAKRKPQYVLIVEEFLHK